MLYSVEGSRGIRSPRVFVYSRGIHCSLGSPIILCSKPQQGYPLVFDSLSKDIKNSATQLSAAMDLPLFWNTPQTLNRSILSGSGLHSCHFGVIEFNGFIESRVPDSVVVSATRNFSIMWHLSIAESQSWVYFPDRNFIAESQSWVYFPDRDFLTTSLPWRAMCDAACTGSPSG